MKARCTTTGRCPHPASSEGEAADAVFLKLYADDKLIKTETQKPAADKAYAFTVKLKAGLIKYKVEFGTKSGGAEKLVQTVSNLVCGDAYLIDGQSNALALDTGEQSPNVTSEWIRSYGGPGGRGDETNWVRDRFANGKRENLWCSPFWRGPGKAALGWWGMELAKRLLASQKMPICIIQAAEGGTRIDEHMPNETDHADLKTMYGHMLWRVKNARLTHGIRAVLWHQGEADQGSDGPDNGYDSAFYQQYFLDMSAAWKEDMPNIRHYYIFQIWPNGCSQGGGHGDMLREVQRTLPRLYSNMDVMSTLGIRPGGGCHYPLTGWSEFARLMQPLIERDFYGKAPAASITAPNLKRAYYTSSAKDCDCPGVRPAGGLEGFAVKPVLSRRRGRQGHFRRGRRERGHAQAARDLGSEDDHVSERDELESREIVDGGQRHRRAHVLRCADRILAAAKYSIIVLETTFPSETKECAR